jgi:cytosine/adenosine deaminase-related metal-dependent hydrolase
MAQGHIVSLDAIPQPHDLTLDLDGAFLYPGLINAHDHLELNNFPRLKWQEHYTNVRDWIAEFRPRFGVAPTLLGPMAVPLAERLFIGGLKNLLSGVATVCHHNPLHPPLRRADFPVRVVQRYRWSHSLLLDGDAQVAQTYRRTPKHQPWIIHAAEGTDAEAAAELQRLDDLNCLGPNTGLVHGVGLRATDRATMLVRGAGLIWCPASNDFMLGATAQVHELAQAGRVALGSDSRLSGSRDLLEELKCAAQTQQVDDCALFRMVTVDAAALLRLKGAGHLAVGAPADVVVLPRFSENGYHNLLLASRRDIRLVVLNGQVQFGDPDLTPPQLQTCAITVDGAPKRLRATLAQRLRACSISEPGVTVEA